MEQLAALMLSLLSNSITKCAGLNNNKFTVAGYQHREQSTHGKNLHE